jgi:hypothetical protein
MLDGRLVGVDLKRSELGQFTLTLGQKGQGGADLPKPLYGAGLRGGGQKGQGKN